MSTSREWSQRHIEELIKKNGGTDTNNITLVFGTPYITSFCVDSMSPNNNGRWNGNIAKTFGNSCVFIRHPGCIEYPIIPVSCRVPVKIANRVLTMDEMNLCEMIEGSGTYNNYYYFVDIGGKDIDDNIFYHGGKIYDYLRPYVYMELCFLTDGESTYLGYAPYNDIHHRYTLTLHDGTGTPTYDDISLTFLKSLGSGRKDIDIVMPYSFRLRDSSRNAKLDYYINIEGYYDDLYNLYIYGTERSCDLIINRQSPNGPIPSELNYLRKMRYIISGSAELISTSKLPTNKQIPKDTSIVGYKFYF